MKVMSQDFIGSGAIAMAYVHGRYPRTLRERILEASPESLVDENADNLDQHKIWAAMMTNEKTGGHGAHLSSCQAWGGHEPPNSSKGSWSRAERRPQRSRRLPNLRGGSDGLRTTSPIIES